MSERMTSVGPRDSSNFPNKGIGVGIADYGRKTRSEMIETFRKYHQRQLEISQAALALTDDELIVHTYVGVWAERKKSEVTE